MCVYVRMGVFDEMLKQPRVKFLKASAQCSRMSERAQLRMLECVRAPM